MQSRPSRARELDGGLAEAYASLGLLRWSVGEMSLAQLALRKAVDLNPSYSMAHLWLGSVLVDDGGALLAAQSEYALAYQLDPLRNVIAYNCARMLGEIGQLDEAKRVQRCSGAPSRSSASANTMPRFSAWRDSA